MDKVTALTIRITTLQEAQRNMAGLDDHRAGAAAIDKLREMEKKTEEALAQARRAAQQPRPLSDFDRMHESIVNEMLSDLPED